MIRSSILVICVIALAGTAAQAAPFAPSQVPASAELVVHFDIDSFKSSRLKKIVGAGIDKAVDQLAGALKRKKVPLSAADIKAVSGVTFWADGSDPERGALIANGVNASRMLKALTRLPEFKIAKHGGYVLTQIAVDGDDTFIGATRRALVIADNKGSVTKTLDAITGKTKTLSGSARARRLSQSGHVLVAAAFGKAIANKIKKQASSPMFRDIGLLRGVLVATERGSTLEIWAELEHKSADGARKLVALGQAGLTMLSMGADNPDLAALAKGVKLSSSGARASIKIRVPYRIIRKAAQGKLDI